MNQPPVPIRPRVTPETRGKYDRAIIIASVLGLGCLFGYYLVYILRRFKHGHFGDFPTFYWAAKAVLDHGDPYVAVEDGLAYVYPPLIASLYTPFAHLAKIDAARVMLPIHLGTVLIALLVAAREILERFEIQVTRAGVLSVTCAAALLAENDLRSQLQAMETDVFMLLCFVLGLRWLDRRRSLCGLALGFAFNIKYLSVCFIPWLILRRRWSVLGWMLFWIIALMFLPAIIAGWHDNLHYLSIAFRGLGGIIGVKPGGQPAANVHHLSDLVSISITSAIARHLRDSGQNESRALIYAGEIGGAVVLMAAWLYRVRELPFLRWPESSRQKAQPYRALVGLEWIGVVAGMLVFSPNTNARHLSMAAFAYVAAAVLLLVPHPKTARWPLLVGVIGMFIGFMLPIPHVSGETFKHRYFVLGCATWSLLLMYCTLLYVGLQQVAAEKELAAD